ncbi:fimbrial protein [Serratia proteamaculans]|uniref:Fimbrial protein n=1 Tax=Serratia proteamaculans TaxID=28151 RepID=A0A5Q2VB38_SERPR|nr:fimbrial protein [Serratia proteamaculans]QGH61588.1 fimbrial protein [Serratia proteamaculans]
MRQTQTNTSPRYWPRVLPGTLLALSLMMVGQVSAKDNNLLFDGALVADPCVLDPKTTDIELDFGTVIDKYLYLNTRTHSRPFTLNLLECDTQLGSSVVMTFKGTESKELPGLLALTGGSATGVAIGMELDDGRLLPFNKATPGLVLQDGVTALRFKGYVQGEPTALKNHSIGRGDFTAVATFEIEYP